jgi:hypothetical protein
VNQPQTPASQVDVCPQPLIFSKDMSYQQLAVWLTNHPQFVGEDDYQQDISKLKGILSIIGITSIPHYCHSKILDAKINGRALFSLNENRLERSGVSLGFQCTLMVIIENLVFIIMYSFTP